jgi:hypothetical protein
MWFFTAKSGNISTIRPVAFSFFSPPALVKRSSLGKLVDQSTFLLMVAIGSLILVLALLILFHENANATKGYRLRNLERERSQLLLEDEILKMQIAQEQALEKLQNDKKVTGMKPAAKPMYLNGEAEMARQ